MAPKRTTPNDPVQHSTKPPKTRRRKSNESPWTNIDLADIRESLRGVPYYVIITAESAACLICQHDYSGANITAPNSVISHLRRTKKCTVLRYVDTPNEIKIFGLKSPAGSSIWASVNELAALDINEYPERDLWLSRVLPAALPKVPGPFSELSGSQSDRSPQTTTKSHEEHSDSQGDDDDLGSDDMEDWKLQPSSDESRPYGQIVLPKPIDMKPYVVSNTTGSYSPSQSTDTSPWLRAKSSSSTSSNAPLYPLVRSTSASVVPQASASRKASSPSSKVRANIPPARSQSHAVLQPGSLPGGFGFAGAPAVSPATLQHRRSLSQNSIFAPSSPGRNQGPYHQDTSAGPVGGFGMLSFGRQQGGDGWRDNQALHYPNQYQSPVLLSPAHEVVHRPLAATASMSSSTWSANNSPPSAPGTYSPPLGVQMMDIEPLDPILEWTRFPAAGDEVDCGMDSWRDLPLDFGFDLVLGGREGADAMELASSNSSRGRAMSTSTARSSSSPATNLESSASFTSTSASPRIPPSAAYGTRITPAGQVQTQFTVPFSESVYSSPYGGSTVASTEPSQHRGPPSVATSASPVACYDSQERPLSGGASDPARPPQPARLGLGMGLGTAFRLGQTWSPKQGAFVSTAPDYTAVVQAPAQRFSSSPLSNPVNYDDAHYARHAQSSSGTLFSPSTRPNTPGEQTYAFFQDCQ